MEVLDACSIVDRDGVEMGYPCFVFMAVLYCMNGLALDISW